MSEIRVVMAIFAILSLAPGACAKSKHDWQQVEKLKSGTPILIALWNGRLVNGTVDAVGPASLRIDTADPEVGVGSLEEFRQPDVRKIVRVHRTNLPDANRWMLIGTLAGAGIGFTSGAIYDATHHENYHWLAGGFGGAVFGFLGSCAILAGVGAVDLFHHHDKLVYADPRSTDMRAN